MTVGKRIQDERLRLGLTLEAMGTAGGVKRQAQSMYEKDERAPDADYLIGIDGIGADILYVLIGTRRIDRAATDHERELLMQAIRHVVGNDMDHDIDAIAPEISAEYDRLYGANQKRGISPSHVISEREKQLLAYFNGTNEAGRKVIERIAQLEAVRGAKPPGRARAIKVKGDSNIAGENISVGSYSVSTTETKKR